jgi:undecaprenyl pyrophosphate phosphatase UppP
MSPNEKLSVWVTLIATVTLSTILLAMVSGMMIGLFEEKVDNNKIFEAVLPAFQTIVGGFIVLITGIKIATDQRTDDKSKEK